MSAPPAVGMSLKMYFSHARAQAWFTAVAEGLRTRAAVMDGAVEVFVVPTYLQIPAALAIFAGTPVRIGAQDLATEDSGPYTGEVSAAELAEVGVSLAEVGHAERRRLFGEDDVVVAAKTAAALRNGVRPLLCIGERQHPAAEVADQAAEATAAQLLSALQDAPAGPLTLAYEPVWAIGAPQPAPLEHVSTVARHLTQVLAGMPERAGSSVIYGGSAGPGLLTDLGSTVDGIFLGRFAHDPAAFLAVVDEAAVLAERVAA
ncbi:triose-phosphate isomerase family protein [Quadrisphaera sp. INWT6]|uniref:triose-phosphate isomerase family protein n=1 Tax=Quadrisphaera sp. INWT6 TaxID=2596917 RepID=UPI0018924D24|nr:triose-phosphate isomerase family protein [Quadrisphaera sp. INWT6]MBF5080762.1 triosephosphate isomerase [Quadrisphaera sp. INWT6]